MAKYIYKNIHFLFTMDPKRIIKMSLSNGPAKKQAEKQ